MSLHPFSVTDMIDEAVAEAVADLSRQLAAVTAERDELRLVAERIVEWMDSNGYKPTDQSFGARAALARRHK